MTSSKIYCLDSNVLIQAWQTYYSPRICPEYWVVLNELGKQRRIVLPQMVVEEINRTEDELSTWLKSSNILKLRQTEQVIQCWKDIQAKNPLHKLLVDNNKTTLIS